ncbi:MULTISPECIES: ABC transporter ATP-binding protein [unclassified Enterococcus]|uniref:ABC transporter ATP-binding protein n=1 Tax=unclassified Enterococcus TaxID=2608891 RepID=UPI00155511CC|nr:MULTISPECIES: ABC transporter ATP-binding protein [unclassified Enterococcus]MBS7578220.1 ABC transporter ATP-binding protein [Enterococcus sp. MMGLQ5-2]MBS7585404.1 ABC transporter ATP-binding protein [Enterococcus sp. MMGLQ5-1]NPD13261.1 ABC transporter ATP-binding protein [Enterococcus sp. MMGLQ5-1]NPD38051.1 ABC transporter ATP-binding protein [Enterococcus sp. MMGLQ5-2]
MNTSIIDLKNVSYIRQGKTLLNQINWQVKKNENWAILGLNGAGKSLLLKLITADIWPSTGSVSILNYQFGKANIPELKQKIGVVSSYLNDRLYQSESVENIVLSGKFASIGIYQKTSARDLEAAKSLIQFLNAAHLIGKSYRTLSQGERQIILIARALMAEPEILILDEPANALDLFARERLLSQISKISKLPDAPTLLYVTHHTEEIIDVFNKMLLIRGGEIIHQGEREAIITENILTHFYQDPVEIVPIIDHRFAIYPKHKQKFPDKN